MLEMLTLDPSAFCTTGFDPGSLEVRVTGQNYLLDWDVLEYEAEASNTSVDALLTDVFAKTLAAAPDTPPFLVFWGVQTGRVLLTMSTHELPLQPALELNLRWKLMACVDSGDGFITTTSKPWLLWDGELLTRLHERCMGWEPNAFYVADLGSYFGPVTGPVPQDMWRRLQEAPGQYPAYRAIPERDGVAEDVRHRWWTLSPRRHWSSATPEQGR